MRFNFINHEDRLREIVAGLVEAAKRGGADAAEAGASESVGLEVSVRGGQLDNMEINREQGVSITVFINGGRGNAGIGDFSVAAQREAVENALAIARASFSDPFAGLAEAGRMATEFPDMDTYHPWEISPDEAIALARQCEDASFAADPRISREKSDGAGVSTGGSLSAYANSHGFIAARRSSGHTIYCQSVATADGVMERDGWSESARNAALLPSAESIGETAGHYAARRLGAGKITDKRANVLFLAPASHSLIGHFIAAASGGALYRKASWLNDRLGENLFAPHLTIREEPFHPGLFGSHAYDSEGVAPTSRAVVENGQWREAFLSAYSARKLGWQTTGNAGGAHNLDITGDTLPKDELMKRLGAGLLVTDLMGQGVNGITGDYSRGAAGFWVENGEIVHPLSEVTIAGNLLTMLPSIAALGDDAMRRGIMNCGSILVPDLTIGGNR